MLAMELHVFIEPQQGASYSAVQRLAQAVEQLGFAGFFTSDHYLRMGDGDPAPGPLDAWTTLAGLARDTDRVRLGTLVSPITFRTPGQLAIIVAQIDEMSGGRVELGLGAGWFEQEHQAHAIPFPALGERFGRLTEQLEILRGHWAARPQQPFSYDGRHYCVTGSPGLRSVIEGFAYLGGHPVLLMSFVVDLIAMVFGMPRALFPQIAHESFGGPDSGGLVFALLFAAIPAGSVIGGVFSGWVSRVDRQGYAVIVCILVWGAAMTGFGVAVGLADRGSESWQQAMLLAALLMLVVGGAADMASAAFRTSMLQSAATDSVRGRLQGVFIVVVAGGPRVADVVHGAAAAAVGTAAAAAGGGVLVVVGTVVAAIAVPSFVRYRITTRALPEAG